MFQSRSDLTVFTLIYEKGSLTEASGLLRMTPGMVSKRLAELERQFRTRLFHRTTRSIQPTDEGRRLYSQARQLLELIEGYEQEWDQNTEPSGLLRVTASASFARMHLMPLIARFLKSHPSVRIDLDLTDRVLDIVSEGIDVAIRIEKIADSSLIAKRLGSGKRVICATPRYLKEAGTPKKPDDLARHNCLVLNGESTWDLERGGRRINQRISGNFATNYGEALVQAVKSGLGIGIVSSWHIADELRSGELKALLGNYPLADEPSIFAVYPSRKFLPLKTRSFLDFLEKNLSADLN